MGTVFNASDYSNSVKLQLLCFRATNAVSSISDYLIEEEENVRRRWNKPWEIITQCCLGLKKWRVWAFYEHQPLNISSEAWLEAQQLFVYHAEMTRTCFWDEFSSIEYDLLQPILGIIEEICGLYGFDGCIREKRSLDFILSNLDSRHDGGGTLLH